MEGRRRSGIKGEGEELKDMEEIKRQTKGQTKRWSVERASE